MRLSTGCSVRTTRPHSSLHSCHLEQLFQIAVLATCSASPVLTANAACDVDQAIMHCPPRITTRLQEHPKLKVVKKVKLRYRVGGSIRNADVKGSRSSAAVRVRAEK